MLRTSLLLGVVLLAAGCGGGDKTVATHPALFGYDRAAPLAFRDRGAVNRGYPIQVRDVSYASPRGGRVSAFLVVPPGKGPFPAVLYLHGSGEDRTRLVVPAAWLAARGAIALAIDSAVGRARPAALFFQDGLDDTVVPHAQLAALAAAGSEPKRIRWYRAGHSLDAQAFRDQLDWLTRKLEIRGPAVPGSKTGP